MKNVFIIIAGLVLLTAIIVVFSVVGNDVDKKSTTTEISFDTLASLEFEDYEGNSVKLSDFKGKFLVVNSWAAWCPFCVQELPDFAQAQEEFKEDIVIIAIDRAESLSTAKRFSDRVGATDKLTFLLDSSDSFYKSIGGFSMPETIFIDKNGEIKEHKRGPMKIEEIRDRIKKAFNI